MSNETKAPLDFRRFEEVELSISKKVVKIYAPLVLDMIAVDGRETTTEGVIELTKRLTGLSKEEIKALDMSDFEEIQNVIKGFRLKKSQTEE